MKKRTSRWLLAIAVVLAIPLVAIAAFWFVSFGSCGSNEEAVSMARGLSQQRLTRLFDDMRAMSRSQGLAPRFLIFEDGRKVPPSIADLHPRGLTLRDGVAIIHLSGCVDDKVSLRIGPDSKGKGGISLEPAEAKDPVVLWTEK
ncbi:hypothetical protein FNZ56_12480 [Pseudoluteimonas lycopersici]|uniref:Uncharacterized protein n=1 Tax=Pseudoluteimonas lycopersici TaxID=1324796 RepID=A0A516V802_9GAMM|nr:hypothetical protein [Lysobacter lycopersici]QDQ74641.1 hypothetical protein FNZ56_12480 [Lysobacter lycopersici]